MEGGGFVGATQGRREVRGKKGRRGNPSEAG